MKNDRFELTVQHFERIKFLKSTFLSLWRSLWRLLSKFKFRRRSAVYYLYIKVNINSKNPSLLKTCPFGIKRENLFKFWNETSFYCVTLCWAYFYTRLGNEPSKSVNAGPLNHEYIFHDAKIFFSRHHVSKINSFSLTCLFKETYMLLENRSRLRTRFCTARNLSLWFRCGMLIKKIKQNI